MWRSMCIAAKRFAPDFTEVVRICSQYGISPQRIANIVTSAIS